MSLAAIALRAARRVGVTCVRESAANFPGVCSSFRKFHRNIEILRARTQVAGGKCTSTGNDSEQFCINEQISNNNALENSNNTLQSLEIASNSFAVPPLFLPFSHNFAAFRTFSSRLLNVTISVFKLRQYGVPFEFELIEI